MRRFHTRSRHVDHGEPVGFEQRRRLPTQHLQLLIAGFEQIGHDSKRHHTVIGSVGIDNPDVMKYWVAGVGLLPFLVLDILVATLVVSTGLVMLPPTLVSLPLKLLVFVAADGWTLVMQALLDGVRIAGS